MKLLPDAAKGPTITAYGSGWVAVNGVRYGHSLVVNAQSGAAPWPCSRFEDLGEQHFEMLVAMAPELVLFGSGETTRFPKPQWLQTLYAQRIGVEAMDTQAACRTYNFLAGEGRRVVAALLV
ncbi:Mth938-like domain-containing protein [Rhodoferax sp.]|jgi:uncharacterized protein|uniref:Mth938-like domain-containing protein n=1 Tax=Rhodoferax sp. TaxID=50421 RepID=UPI003783707D